MTKWSCYFCAGPGGTIPPPPIQAAILSVIALPPAGFPQLDFSAALMVLSVSVENYVKGLRRYLTNE
jgi:hypothetical protein